MQAVRLNAIATILTSAFARSSPAFTCQRSASHGCRQKSPIKGLIALKSQQADSSLVKEENEELTEDKKHAKPWLRSAEG
eukprot:2792286-Amphidinium_carterae.1